MFLKLAADFVVLLHLAFILFVVLGGLVVFRWPRFMWLHIPAVAWGAFIELTGRVCPLTPLENRLRIAAGQAGYSGGFIEEYLTSEDVTAWHEECTATPHVEELMEAVNTDCIQIWGSYEGPEPVSVNLC